MTQKLQNLQKLGRLGKGVKGVIQAVGSEDSSSLLVSRLLEMGFMEGSAFEVLHVAPFGADPIAVRVRGAIVALRREEANGVEVLVYE